MTEKRYTGGYYQDGHTDCTAGRHNCQYEQDVPCWHCGTHVREHLDEDGTAILVQVGPPPDFGQEWGGRT